MTNFTGQSFGRYHLLEQLGEGGMAAVYKAYDTRLERDVAIKVIRVDKFAPAELERILKRFEREAKALARLTHPNIVPVIDYGDYEGAPYLVMPYLPGGTLKQNLGKPMPWQDAVHLLLPIAQALGYAHDHNIIHRDIKPSNILLTENGQPMLSDFGIAKIIESEDVATLTGTGTGVGTPEYMAPEQWTGGTVLQSDVYSLGVVLYELVTGRKPYIADTPVAILLKQASEPLPLPRQIVRDLPESVEKVILKSLAKKPEDRYEHMVDMVAAMETLLSRQSQRPQLKQKSKPVPLPQRTDDSVPTLEQVAGSKEIPPSPPPVRKVHWWPWAVPAGLLFVVFLVFAVLAVTGKISISTVNVDSKSGWQDSGIAVNTGDTINLQVLEGKWTSDIKSGIYNSGEGGSIFCNTCLIPLQGFHSSSLIGEIGPWVFEIGNGITIVAKQSGELLLRMNESDSMLSNNFGVLKVRIFKY
jgi:serine/threonine protein kinase